MSQLSIVLRTELSGPSLVEEVEALLAKAEHDGMSPLRYVHSEAVETGTVAHIWQGLSSTSSLKIVEDEAMNGKYALASGMLATKVLNSVGDDLGVLASGDLREYVKSNMRGHPDAVMLLAFDLKSRLAATTRSFILEVIETGSDEQVAAAVSAIALMRDRHFLPVLKSRRTNSQNDEVRNALDYTISVLSP